MGLTSACNTASRVIQIVRVLRKGRFMQLVTHMPGGVTRTLRTPAPT